VYELVVVGCAERTLRVALEDLVDEQPHSGVGGSLAVRVTDQARLVAAIERLHDLGVVIENVHHVG
jgi:hypothetical protein